MNQEILSILEPQEQIIWQDKINRKVIFFYLIISLLIVLSISFFSFSKETINYTANNTPKTIAGTTVGLIILIVGSIISLLAFFSNYVKEYFISNKRIIIKSGLIGTDFNSIYFPRIRTLNVNVNLIDKFFSVGTINIDTGKIETISGGRDTNTSNQIRTAYDKFLHIKQPYEVYKYLETTLSKREESLYSGRADRENNPAAYQTNAFKK